MQNASRPENRICGPLFDDYSFCFVRLEILWRSLARVQVKLSGSLHILFQRLVATSRLLLLLYSRAAIPTW